MFRCAAPGMISNLLEEVGFTEIREQVVEGHIHCASNEEYWEFMNDVVPPVVAACKDMDPYVKEQIQQDLNLVLRSKLSGHLQYLSYCARLFSARKPA